MKKHKKAVKKKRLLNAYSGKSTIAIIFIVLGVIFALFYIAGEQPHGIREPKDYMIESNSSLTPGHSLQMNGFRLITPTPMPTLTPTPSPTYIPLPQIPYTPPPNPGSEQCAPVCNTSPPAGCRYEKDPSSCGCGALICPKTPPPVYKPPPPPKDPPPAL